MKATLRVCLRFLYIPAILVLLCAATALPRQSQDGSRQREEFENGVGPKKPTRNSGWVQTNDPVALLAVRRAPPERETPAIKTEHVNAELAAAGKPEAAAERAAEIASLDKQIQERQKRIAFLMRMFVRDERPFLNDPENSQVDATVQERRKYEQDELLWETSQLAKLKTRLGELTRSK